MAKTLREFLEGRAKADYLAARNIMLFAQKGAATNREANTLKQYDAWLGIFDPGVVNRLYSFSASPQSLREAELYLISCAGEVIKTLEKEVPDIHERIPDFPWKAFKKVRDMYVKLAENLLDSDEYMQTLNGISQHIDTINLLGEFDSNAEKFKGLPYFKLAMVMMNWASAVAAFYKDAPPRGIMLTGDGDQVHKLSKSLGVALGNLPGFMYILVRKSELCMLHEQFDVPSVFFKSIYPHLYDEKITEPLKKLRDKYAHFEDVFDAYANNTGTEDEMFLDMEFLEGDEATIFHKTCKKISAALVKINHAHLLDKEAEVLSELVQRYEMKFIGIARNEVEKRTLLDAEVAWVTCNKYHKKIEDCYVLAASSVIQRLSPKDAEQVLSYVHGCVNGNKKALRMPVKLLEGLENHSEAIQVGIRTFVSEYRKAMGVKEGRAAA